MYSTLREESTAPDLATERKKAIQKKKKRSDRLKRASVSMKSTPPAHDAISAKRIAGVMFSKWRTTKKTHHGRSSVGIRTAAGEKEYRRSASDEPKKRIRKRPSSSQSKMMIMGPLKPKIDVKAVPSLPDEILSLDTKHSTPRAKTNKLHRGNVDASDRFEQQRRLKDSCNSKESFILPYSIDFLSLLLPGNDDANIMVNHEGGDNDEEWSSIMSKSDTGTPEDATITSGAFSFVSGRTVLAKDRVQETISSTMNIDYFFNSSPRAVDDFPSFQQNDVPINVDFVLESSKDELAAFAKRCIRSGRYRDAIDIYESVLEHHMNRRPIKNHVMIPILHNLGIVHTWNGNYNKALYYCNECLRYRREILGHDHLEVASSLSELGIIHYAKEDFNKSLGAFREALQIYSKANKPHKPNHGIARTLNNIGCIHFSTGKLSASLSTFEECLELQRRTMGSIMGSKVDRMLFNMSVTLINAATVARKQGNITHAASLMEEGLVVQQSVLPDDHRIVLSVQKSLSRMEGSRDQFQMDSPSKAKVVISPESTELTFRQRLHNICNAAESASQKKHNVHSEDLNFSCAEMLTLGSPKVELDIQERIKLHMNVHRLPAALIAEGNSKRHCSWVDIHTQKDKSRDENFNFLEIAKKSAKYVERNEIRKAIQIFENLKRSHRTKCGDVTYILGSISYMLGIIYLYSSQYDQAMYHFKDSMKIRSNVLDSDHTDVLASLIMMAITMMALKNFDAAQSHLEKVLRLTRKKYGYYDEKVAVILNNIGLCHFEMGGHLTALKTFEECVEILREVARDDQKHLEANVKVQIWIMLSRSLNNLGFIRVHRREYADAIVVMEEALNLQRRIFGEDSQVVKETLKSLGSCMATANCDNNKDKMEHMAEMYADMLAA